MKIKKNVIINNINTIKYIQIKRPNAVNAFGLSISTLSAAASVEEIIAAQQEENNTNYDYPLKPVVSSYSSYTVTAVIVCCSYFI